MTQEQLQKANELSKKINELESFKSAFNNASFKYINAVDLSREKRYERKISVPAGSELHAMINDYIFGQLHQLKTEFKNL